MSALATPVDPVPAALRIVGMGVLSAGIVAAAAATYRWYTRERVPEGVAILLGLGSVAAYLNTTAALGSVIGGSTELFAPGVALVNVLVFAAAAAGAPAGRLLGDRVATDVFAVAGATHVNAEVSQIVRTVGRVTAVTLPDDIEDMADYDPVPPATRDELAGKTLVFPRRLTVEQLRDRLVARLKDDYRVGHVDVDVTADGTVEYLALGGRMAGLGPTLAPGTAAVTVRADPAFAAAPGDLVQVWTTGDDPSRVLTAELRGVAEDVVTLAVDEPEADRLDPETSYRLVTLPTEPRVDREFTSLLRAADETMAVATVTEDSALAGATLGSLDVSVVAVRSEDGDLAAIPPRGRTVSPGDSIYAIGRPEVLRRFEAAAGKAEPSL